MEDIRYVKHHEITLLLAAKFASMSSGQIY